MSNYLRWWHSFLRSYPTNNMSYSPYGPSGSGGSGGSGGASGGRNRHTRRQPAQPKPKPKPADKPKDGKMLKVKNVDLKKVLNRRQHHTNKFEKEELIIRRGQRIELTLEFDRGYDEDKDDVIFQMEFGDDPRPSKGTMYSMKSQKGWLDPSEWKVRRLGKPDGKTEVNFRLIPAADAPIGRWKLTVKTVDKETGNSDEHEVEDDIIILFNPWCYADQCFMGADDDDSDDGSNWGSDGENTDEDSSGSENDDDDDDAGPGKRKANTAKLREYIMNDTGYVYRGNEYKISGKSWNFAQFEDPCLDAALYLLDISGIREGARANPTLVSRKLSQMANSNDDDGVLAGKWGGGYAGGVSPGSWNGSQAILEQYMKTKSEVKYGQCWVFSCLLTTLNRALGLPTRTVTNFASAHDTDFSMTIDKHLDEDGDKLSRYDDSIWNFHVWNEAWMKRPDLPEGYDGWQAFDSTPQEISEGVMQCGPAPLKAIRNGEVYVGYDTKFLYGEVNGDVMTWLVNNNNEIKAQKIEKQRVGKKISTKCVGKLKQRRMERYGRAGVAEKSRKDVTHLYKHKEGSEEEREANAKAMIHSTRKGALDDLPDEGDVTFDFKADESRNGDMTTRLTATNKSKETRTVKVKVSIHAVYYTGQSGDAIKADEAELTLSPGEEKEHVTTITTTEYINKMEADAAVNFYCRAKVVETEQRFVSEDLDIKVEKPDLELKPSNPSPKVNESFSLGIKFTNPLNVAMTNLSLHLEGSGVTKDMKVSLSAYGRRLDPGQELDVSVDLKSRVKGKHEIIASLTSNQLTDIDGECLINVKK